MSAPKHTPGPWMVCTDGESHQFGNVLASCEHGCSVAIPCAMAHGQMVPRPQWSNEARANARLIAAAPDMLEALKRVCEETEGSGDDHEPACLFCSTRDRAKHELYCFVPLAVAAIAKAEGA